MEQFLYQLGNLAILVLIISLLILGLIIYLIWRLLKTAIARGVEDGIYNAVISLKNDGVINGISDDIEEIKQVFDPKIPSKENTPNNINEQESYYKINK